MGDEENLNPPTPAPFTIVLKPGQWLRVELMDTDGHFDLKFDYQGSNELSVHADLPDSQNRVGIIYSELMGPLTPDDMIPAEPETPEHW